MGILHWSVSPALLSWLVVQFVVDKSFAAELHVLPTVALQSVEFMGSALQLLGLG